MNYEYGDWSTIVKDYENIDKTYKCKPDITKFPKHKEGDIIDENQTVKWNKEEVARRMQAYKDEVNRLNTARNQAFNKWTNDVVNMIAKELIDTKLFKEPVAKEKAYIIYNKAYADAHSYGIYDVLQKADDYIDFITDIL